MNWFTYRSLAGASVTRLHNASTSNSVCEHVEADSAAAAGISYEHDSFGSEGYVVCQKCRDEMLRTEAERTIPCVDCGRSLPASEMHRWTPYDYYPAQGDEPSYVCASCVKAERHVARMSRDAEDRLWELGY